MPTSSCIAQHITQYAFATPAGDHSVIWVSPLPLYRLDTGADMDFADEPGRTLNFSHASYVNTIEAVSYR